MSRGAGVVGFGATLCLLAAAFGTPALYVPGIALMVLVAGTRAWVRCAARGVRLVRRPDSVVAEEGERVTLELAVRRPLLGRGGELAPLPGTAFEGVRRRKGRRLIVDVTARTRGAHVLGPSQMRFRDPFGISERTVSSTTTEMLVLPRVERIATVDIQRLVGGAPADSPPGDSWGEVDGLRAARLGVRAAQIHWPTVARTGTLVERRLAPEPDARPLVVLDARDPAEPEALDMAVRAAASFALAFARHGGCALLLPGEQLPHRLDAQLRGWRQLHGRLALIQAGSLAWAQCTRAPLVVLVSASAHPRAPEVGRAPPGYLVSPFPSAEGRVLFEVAGCAVQPMGRRLARVA